MRTVVSAAALHEARVFEEISMGQRNEELFGVTFEHFDNGPVLAYVRPGRIALRRKRALWVARAIAVSKRWELRRRRRAAALQAQQAAGNHNARH